MEGQMFNSQESHFGIQNVLCHVTRNNIWKQEGDALSRILTGVSNLLASLGHSGRRVVLGHTLNPQVLTQQNYLMML